MTTVYVYHDWVAQATPAARLSRLRLHLAEVAAVLADEKVSVASDGKSMTRSDRQRYYDGLLMHLAELERRPTASVSGGMSYARLNRVGSGGS